MDQIKEIVEKLQSDSGLLEEFKKDPAAAVKKLAGGLPQDEIEKVIMAVKAKLDLEKVEDVVEGAVDKIKGLFGK